MVGMKMRRLREYFDLDQSQVCEKLGMTQSQLSDIERGRRGMTLERLQDVIRAFPVDVRFFFDQDIETIEDADLRTRAGRNPQTSVLEDILARLAGIEERLPQVANDRIGEIVRTMERLDAERLARVLGFAEALQVETEDRRSAR